MSIQGKYAKLLSPLQVTPELTFKNRMIKAPQSTWYWNEDGSVSQRAIDFYQSLAKGGAGMIVIAGIHWTYPQPGGIYAAMYDDKYTPGWKQMVDALHQHGCKVFAQLHHTGPSAPANYDGTPPIGPSGLTEDEIPCPPPTVVPGRGMTREEILENQELYLKAAERAQEAGFDGIEVHCAHAYYFESFLSRVWNKRTDEYGAQSLEDRSRLVVDTIREMKKRLGADYPLGMRLNGREWGNENALTIEECVEFAKIFEAEGINYLSISGYGYGDNPFRYLPDYWPYPEPDNFMKEYMKDFKGQGLFVPSAAAIKRAINIPVAVAGRMDEDLAEELIGQGKVDFIALGRTLWADPEFPNKVAEGRTEDIVRCTRCGTCEDPIVGPRRCRVNPALGRERELAIKPAEKKKKIIVVGGGPAGMEAARVAALRGHDVTIYEKESKLGGMIPLASMIKGNDVEDVIPIIEYLKTQVGKLPIKVKTGKEVTPQLLAKENPDAVIVAVGGLYKRPNIQGANGKNVSDSNTLLAKVRPFLRTLGPQRLHSLTHLFLPVGKRVIVIGGQIEGCQGAVFLAKRGRAVTILEPSNEVGKGIPPKFFSRMSTWFKQKGIDIVSGIELQEITNQGVKILRNGKQEFIAGDSVMVLPSMLPNNELAEGLKGKIPEVHLIGSAQGAKVGSLIVDALLDGRRIGCSI